MLIVVCVMISILLSAGSNAKRLNEKQQEGREKDGLNSCDMTFYCVTGKSVSVSARETKVMGKETFMFALKGGELIVSRSGSPLGDGTLNYRITEGGCDKETGKLKDYLNFGKLSLGKNFRADMLEGKWVEYEDGMMFLIDASYSNVSKPVRIQYATCETFDEEIP
jgi:hypothetical protein